MGSWLTSSLTNLLIGLNYCRLICCYYPFYTFETLISSLVIDIPDTGAGIGTRAGAHACASASASC